MHKDIKYYLVMIANPVSNSEVAISIYKMFRRLDILSRDITIFFPGFHQVQNRMSDNEEDTKKVVSDILDYNKTHFQDYHGHSPIYHTYCDSLGDIYFNEADYAQFINDFEDHSSRFVYDGKTQLVLLPSQSGNIIYDNIKSYDLETLYKQNSNSCQIVEEFLVSILRALQKDNKKNSLELIDLLDNIYNCKLESTAKQYSQNQITIHLDDMIINHMKWANSGEIFFISYSTKDVYHAFALKALLEKNNKLVWIAPDGIPDGSDYACAIPAAIRISSRVVVLLSHNSVNSPFVRREVGKAISTNKRIDCITLDNFTIDDIKNYADFDYLLEGIQIKYSINDLFDNKVSLNKWLNNN